MATDRIKPNRAFSLQVERQSEQKVYRCYQCGKCTAGCPAAYVMDLGPRRIMRGVQLGLKEEVLNSTTLWLCLFCQTCSARCPLDIDIARVLESLRLLAVAEGKVPGDKDVALFHSLFLQGVERLGRVHELSLGAFFNLQGGHPLLNVDLLPRMVITGKLPLLPPRAKGRTQARAILQRIKAMRATNLSPTG